MLGLGAGLKEPLGILILPLALSLECPVFFSLPCARELFKLIFFESLFSAAALRASCSHVLYHLPQTETCPLYAVHSSCGSYSVLQLLFGVMVSLGGGPGHRSNELLYVAFPPGERAMCV